MTDRPEMPRPAVDRRFSVAPMMDWTDRHDRYFLRQISRRALLFTEMITTGALIFGDAARHLAHDPSEHPVAVQLGGSDPRDLAIAARIAADAGYDEINLNCGCPSDRVQSGRFGACLMAEPALVAECVAAMAAVVDVPVTVKCRIGIDDQDEAETLFRFVETVAAAGAGTFYVHARKAWLKGLSPKENREIPPLNYPLVHALKRARPDLEILLNGGLVDLDQAEAEIASGLDGVMLGRAAYHDPYILAEVDARIYGEGDATAPIADRIEIARRMLPYIEAEVSRGTALIAITRHMLGLFQGLPGARRFRRSLSENHARKGAGPEVLVAALEEVSSRRRDAA
ncbi:tRNA dihydrouridine(20/20a) synthase DusA [Tistrella bauzanensis]|uniref:tRNA-dihydrouridine(20/20a) synthase n=1 Tax=Tistrella arctica TaxID=3133430 RepID=A0ABU9YHR9_9PROT